MTAHDKEYGEYFTVAEFRRGQFALLIIVMCVFLYVVSRADSTKVFVPIEKPKPTICQRVCPVCGGCAPMFSCYDRDTKLPCVSIYDSISFYCTGKTVGGTFPSFKMSAGDYYSCDSIVWGTWREICRVDTVGKRLVGGPPNEPYALWWQRIDTIYTGDQRCNNSLNPIGDKQKK